ncbi:MAG: ribonuclease HI [Rickettsiales bacterium]|nr:ribonuclease HI [Rickettsiales bacterium]
MSEFTIYTDGACSGNPGAGGWGAIIDSSSGRREMHGGDVLTTNNKMELLAVIRALESLEAGVSATVITDSQYVQKGITAWISDWKRRGWRTAAKKPVANRELWERLDALASARQVEWRWVKGHAGHPENERADELARMGIDEVRGGASGIGL